MPKYRPNKCRDEQSRVRTDFGTNKPEQRLLKMDNESKPTNTVVAGEASESDDDDSEMNKELSSTKPGAKVIVSGEASESDEEADTTIPSIPPLNVNTSEEGDKGDITNTAPLSPVTTVAKEEKPKYNTLLNKKLRERNVALRRHILESANHSYTAAGKDLHNITLQLLKTQITVQDISHTMRNNTNDLFNLEDKVDIVTNCNILPNIVLPSNQTQSS